MVTLMHDTQYREAIAWQNAAYNQPPHPSFYLGAGMSAPPTPAIYSVVNGDFDGNGTVDGADLDVWRVNAGQSGLFGKAVGDADADRDTDGFDFLVWQRNLGRGAPPPAATITAAATIAAAGVAADESPDAAFVSPESVIGADSSVASLASEGLPGLNTSTTIRAATHETLTRPSYRPVASAIASRLADVEHPSRKLNRTPRQAEAIDLVHELKDGHGGVAASLDDAFAGL